VVGCFLGQLRLYHLKSSLTQLVQAMLSLEQFYMVSMMLVIFYKKKCQKFLFCSVLYCNFCSGGLSKLLSTVAGMCRIFFKRNLMHMLCVISRAAYIKVAKVCSIYFSR
jgi:hypothetical protein